MVIPQQILKSVVFIGCENHSDNTYFYFGTAFFFGLDAGNGRCSRVCLITARHVIQKIRAMGADNVCIRLNLKNGTSKWEKTDISKWYFPQNEHLDIALFERGTTQAEDHLVVPHVASIMTVNKESQLSTLIDVEVLSTKGFEEAWVGFEVNETKNSGKQ